MPKQSGYVNVPRTYKTPGSHKVELAYITNEEAKKLKELDLHNSGIGKKMHYGPKGIPNYNGGGGGFGGGFGDDKDAGGREGAYSGSASIARLGETLDWGMGPEGSAGTISSSRAGEHRDFGDDVSLQQKTAFMATAPVSKPAFVAPAKPTPVAPVTNITNYLEDTTVPKISRTAPIREGRPLDWSSPIRETPSQVPTFDPSAGVPGSTETQPFTSGGFFKEGPEEVMAEALAKMGIGPETVRMMSPELIAALTIGKRKGGVVSTRIEPSALGKNVAASYEFTQIDPITGQPRPGTDQIRVGSSYTSGDVVHELGHRLAMEASRLGILDKISMPNVQSLFETGGSGTTPGYGAQGEMVTSRAGTAQDLVDAMSLARQKDWGWEDDYWADVTGVHPTAAKGGWTTNTRRLGDTYQYSPDQMQGAFSPTGVPIVTSSGEWGEEGMPLTESFPGWWSEYTGANVAYPSQDYTGVTRPVSPDQAHPNTVPGGGGGYSGGYQDWTNWQQELPSINYGGAYTDVDEGFVKYGDWTPEQLRDLKFNRKGKQPWGPTAVTGDYWNQGGLLNWPMKGHHGLIQDFILRNKNLLSGDDPWGTGSTDIEQADYNQMVALNRTNPAAKIQMIEQYNLPTEFWDKLDAYLSQNPSEYSPAGSAATVQKTMSMNQ